MAGAEAIGPVLRVSDADRVGILHPSIPRRVPEAAYLTVPRAEWYRVIIHYFHEQYKLQQHRLKTRQVWQFVRDRFSGEYTLDQCRADLTALGEMGNLHPEQDRDSVGSAAEWHSRDTTYSLKPLTIRLEQALEAARHETGSGGELDHTLIHDIRTGMQLLTNTLRGVTPAQEQDPDWLARHVRSAWTRLATDFDRLSRGTTAFHHALAAARPTDLTEADALRAYKLILIDNLERFIVELVDARESLREHTQAWEGERLGTRLINVLAAYDAKHVVDPQKPIRDPVEIADAYARQVRGLISWFAPEGGADLLRQTTRSAIETASRTTARLTDWHRAGTSRRADLTRLAAAFGTCRSLDDAHRLAALVLGVPTARHFVGAEQWGTLTSRHSVWDQPPHEIPLRRIVRGAKPKSKPQPVADRTAEQVALMQEEERLRLAEADAWDALFANGPLHLDDLELDNPTARDRILEALDGCLLTEDGYGTASDGTLLRLLPPPADAPPGRIRAPDGELLLPRYTLIREEVA